MYTLISEQRIEGSQDRTATPEEKFSAEPSWRTLYLSISAFSNLSFRYFSSFQMNLSHLGEAECVGEAENPEEVEPLLERPLETPLVISFSQTKEIFNKI